LENPTRYPGKVDLICSGSSIAGQGGLRQVVQVMQVVLPQIFSFLFLFLLLYFLSLLQVSFPPKQTPPYEKSPKINT
jgi:hypothetical protein